MLTQMFCGEKKKKKAKWAENTIKFFVFKSTRPFRQSQSIWAQACELVLAGWGRLVILVQNIPAHRITNPSTFEKCGLREGKCGATEFCFKSCKLNYI